MSYKMNHRQLENVFTLSSEQRFQHFISKLCDWEELWILEDTQQNSLIMNCNNINNG